MRSESIEAMLADPNIDPTGWVGKALMKWVEENPLTVLTDKNARKYLFQGMDFEDARVLVKGVVEEYAQSNDPNIIRSFISGLNRVLQQPEMAHQYSVRWGMTNILRNLNTHVDDNTIDAIVSLYHPGTDGEEPWEHRGDKLWKYLKPRHAKEFIRNRKPTWTITSWCKLLELIPRDEMCQYIVTELKDVLIPVGMECGPTKVQDILHYAFLRIRMEEADKYLNFLKGYEVKQLWRGSHYDMISKKRDTSNGLYFDELTCRCGYVAANKSGIKCHSGFCGVSSRNLYKDALILKAQTDPNMCNKCAKFCKTESGLTLHAKKCKSEQGQKLLDMRETQALNEQIKEDARKAALKNDNANENQVS